MRDLKILIIDDDKRIRSLLERYLGEQGFIVDSVADGEQMKSKLEYAHYDLLILDWMLPGESGLSLCQNLKAKASSPAIIMLTANGSENDRISGLEAGADDYLPKPCNPRELVARLRAILRRTQKTPVHKPIIEHHNIVVDCSKRIVKLAGEELELTNAEFNILEMLIKSPGQAFSKEELTEYALGRKYTAYDRSIDVHISNLRNKLGEDETGEAIVKTVRGFGYLFQGE